MTRVALIHLLLFVLPIVLLIGWHWAMWRVRPASIAPRAWGLAVLAGSGLVLVALFSWQGGARLASPNEIYQPPQWRDGELVPGQFAPRADEPRADAPRPADKERP